MYHNSLLVCTAIVSDDFNAEVPGDLNGMCVYFSSLCPGMLTSTLYTCTVVVFGDLLEL